MTEVPDALDELRHGNRIQLSSSDNLQPPFHTTTMFVYKAPALASFDVVETFTKTVAPQLEASLLGFVEASCPHLSCVGYRDLTEGGIMYLEGPLNRVRPMFSSAVVDDWAPRPQDLYNGHMTNFPFPKLLWNPAEVEAFNTTHSNGVPPADTSERKYFPPLLKAKACLCYNYTNKEPNNSTVYAYVTIVLEVYHEVCDASSLSMLAKGWSAFYNAKFCGGDATPATFTIAPHLLRGDVLAKTASSAAPSTFPQEFNAPFPNGFHFIDACNMHNFLSQSPKVVYSTVRLRFKNNDLQAIQDRFNAEHPILVEDADGKKIVGGKYSKNDILVAMNWKAMYSGAQVVGLAEELFPCAFFEEDGISNGGPVANPKQREVPMAKVMVPIALRGKIPGVDATFLGNALRPGLCVMPLDDLLGKPLHEIATFVHLEVRKCASREHVTQALTWMEQERPFPRTGGLYLGTPKCPSCTSWVHYNLFDAKFNLFNLSGAEDDQLSMPRLASVVRLFQIPNLGVFLSTPPPLVAKEANAEEEYCTGIDYNVCLATVQLEAMLKMDYYVGRVVGTQL